MVVTIRRTAIWISGDRYEQKTDSCNCAFAGARQWQYVQRAGAMLLPLSQFMLFELESV
jgi:hypothetical protein